MALSLVFSPGATASAEGFGGGGVGDGGGGGGDGDGTGDWITAAGVESGAGAGFSSFWPHPAASNVNKMKTNALKIKPSRLDSRERFLPHTLLGMMFPSYYGLKRTSDSLDVAKANKLPKIVLGSDIKKCKIKNAKGKMYRENSSLLMPFP